MVSVMFKQLTIIFMVSLLLSCTADPIKNEEISIPNYSQIPATQQQIVPKTYYPGIKSARLENPAMSTALKTLQHNSRVDWSITWSPDKTKISRAETGNCRGQQGNLERNTDIRKYQLKNKVVAFLKENASLFKLPENIYEISKIGLFSVGYDDWYSVHICQASNGLPVYEEMHIKDDNYSNDLFTRKCIDVFTRIINNTATICEIRQDDNNFIYLNNINISKIPKLSKNDALNKALNHSLKNRNYINEIRNVYKKITSKEIGTFLITEDPIELSFFYKRKYVLTYKLKLESDIFFVTYFIDANNGTIVFRSLKSKDMTCGTHDHFHEIKD